MHLLSPDDLTLNEGKRELIDLAFERGTDSFADLGGGWAVEGGFTFYALERHRVTRAFLVDTHPTLKVQDRARAHPELRLIAGNFGRPELAQGIDADVVFLFDVLLHQVAPDWNQILEMYRPRFFCIYNQQWMGRETVRLIDLGEEEYFKNVPHHRDEGPYRSLWARLDEIHPEHHRKWRDVHHIWQWGITDPDLIATMNRLGYDLTYFRNHGRFGELDNFQNHAFLFTWRDASSLDQMAIVPGSD